MTKLIYKYLGGIVIIALLGSCDVLKPAQDTDKDKVYKDKNGNLEEIQGKRVFNPETGEWETINEITEAMDTVQWVDLPANQFPPITSEGIFDGGTVIDGGGTTTADGSLIKSSYNVSFLLPFNTQYFDEASTEISRNSAWGINFYAGAELAFDILREEGVNLNVHVFDTKGDQNKLKNLLAEDEAIGNADVIMGPYLRSSAREVAEWAKNRDKLVVSPFAASMNITEKNPNYLQVNPSILQHCRAIMNHALENYSEEDIVFIAQDEQDERQFLSYLQTARHEYFGVVDTAKITEFIVKDETADFRETDVTPYINEGGTTVFIIPSYKSESFIYSMLRQLAINKTPMDNIVVYGLPPWEKYTRIDFDYYENLNVHISSGSFVDNFDPNVRLFKQKFFDRYGTPPRDEAFLGYDVTLYTGRMLKEYGTKFQYAAETLEPSAYLQNSFNFERIINNPNPNLETDNEVDQFENKAVHILKFSNYYFQPAE